MKYHREAANLLAKARAYVRHKSPYQARVCFGLIPVPTVGYGTLGVTKGMVLYYDPVWFVEIARLEEDYETKKGTLQFEQHMDAIRGFCLAHECWHIMRGMRRMEKMEKLLIAQGMDPKMAKALPNMGFDIAINFDLGKMGYTVPAWVLTPATYNFDEGLTGEEYTRLLVDKQDETKKTLKKLKDAMKDLPQSPGGEGQGDDNDDGIIGAGACGGCANNKARQDFEDKLDKEHGRSEADKKRIRKAAVKEAREWSAKGRGYMPADATMEIDKEKPPAVVPWRSRMSRVIRNTTGRIMAGNADFSLARPAMRSWTIGIVRPGLISKQVEVAFLEDSSYSMGMEQILSVRAEACSLMRALGITHVWFLDADAAVSMEPIRIGVRELATRPVHGRGGTNFGPALEAVQKLRPKVDLAVYFTDGDGTAPATAPKGMEVVWCIVPSPYATRPAKWGHLVVVDDNQEVIDRFSS